ncbi:MAG: hypothetical protein ACJAY8_000541 [Sphingobacteriales bacterium]|jgi:hypothetical protein
MKQYFHLQHKMLNRQIQDFGVPVVAAYIVVPVIFVLLSHFIFLKTEFAPYFFGALALGFVLRFGAEKRNDFLRTIFKRDLYFKLRMLENAISVFPFLVYLGWRGNYSVAIVVMLLALVLARFSINSNFSLVLPTPFAKKPFEFVVGFRKTFLLLLGAYVFTIVAVYVDNFGLGVFAQLVIGLVVISFYSKPENEYFVWSYSLSVKSFLRLKIRACLINFTVLSAPVILTLAVFYMEDMGLIIAFYLLSLLYLIAFVLAKYSGFPAEMSLGQGLMLGFCFVFPPLLLIVIPLFYSQSLKKLNAYLVC